MYPKKLSKAQQAVFALMGRAPHKPPVQALGLTQRGISSTAARHKGNPGASTAPEKRNTLPGALSRTDKTKNTKKSKKEPSPLAEIRRIQKMSVEELKEFIVSSGYELPECTCTWPSDYNPEIEFMERMEKDMKDQEKRERREQREKGEQCGQKRPRRGGR